jgi:hypothetical protein
VIAFGVPIASGHAEVEAIMLEPVHGVMARSGRVPGENHLKPRVGRNLRQRDETDAESAGAEVIRFPQRDDVLDEFEEAA